MRAAKIAPLSPAAAPAYLGELEGELRRQTAGIGLDVLRVGNSIVIRIPAALTFDANSAAVKPQFDATLREIARTVKTRNQTYRRCLRAQRPVGLGQVQSGAVGQARGGGRAPILSRHGVAKARIASRGLRRDARRSTIPETSETEKAANRRVEIRLVPYPG